MADPVVAADEFYSQGMQILQSSEAQVAFDMHSERGEVRSAYGRSAFGQRALLARRLVGAGVPVLALYFSCRDPARPLFHALG